MFSKETVYIKFLPAFDCFLYAIPQWYLCIKQTYLQIFIEKLKNIVCTFQQEERRKRKVVGKFIGRKSMKGGILEVTLN